MPHILFCYPITNESPRARDGDGDGIEENEDNGDDCCDHSSVHCLVMMVMMVMMMVMMVMMMMMVMVMMVMIAVPTLVYTACPHIKLFVHDHKPPIKVPRIEV